MGGGQRPLAAGLLLVSALRPTGGDGECVGVRSCVSCTYTYDSLGYDGDEDNLCVKEHQAGAMVDAFGTRCPPGKNCGCRETVVYYAWSVVGVLRACVGEDACKEASTASGYGLTVTHTHKCCATDDCNHTPLKKLLKSAGDRRQHAANLLWTISALIAYFAVSQRMR